MSKKARGLLSLYICRILGEYRRQGDSIAREIFYQIRCRVIDVFGCSGKFLVAMFAESNTSASVFDL